MNATASYTAYVTCALWASTDSDTSEPLDRNHDANDIAPEARESMRSDVVDFLGEVERLGLDISELTPEQVGHDFWLTRNRHGAGFWDRGLGQLGDDLTTVAHGFGESDLYVGDDRRIYVYP